VRMCGYFCDDVGLFCGCVGFFCGDTPCVQFKGVEAYDEKLLYLPSVVTHGMRI